MKIYNGCQSTSIDLKKKGCVLTIGNFDGMHLGHQALIRRAQDMANDLCLPLALMTFYPHPMSIFCPDKFETPIFSRRQKQDAAKKMGVDIYIDQDFNSAFYTLSCREFIEQILLNLLRVGGLAVGKNYRFGARAAGDWNLLESSLLPLGVKLGSAELVEVDGRPISSSRIRKHLREGNLNSSNKLLGCLYEMVGTVVHGDKRGKRFGFPTANIQSENLLLPHGVYATTSEIGHSLTNIGTRPTVDGETGVHIETHFLDQSPELYGKRIRIQFVDRIRDEKKFSDVESLKTQINLDIEFARMIFSRVNP